MGGRDIHKDRDTPSPATLEESLLCAAMLASCGCVVETARHRVSLSSISHLVWAREKRLLRTLWVGISDNVVLQGAG